ncbi:MAG: manganese efflux pump MntP family protein, partial [Succinivibrio sp.]|nr:manganese efflux pump MntP family protein [Succinivibrio sp.]
LVSGNMVKEAFEKSEDTKEKTLNLFVLFSLSIATSIDALALGFSVSVLNQSILLLSIIIGVVCFITSATGFFVGQILAKLKGFERALNLLGAITLMTIALAILVEHQAF